MAKGGLNGYFLELAPTSTSLQVTLNNGETWKLDGLSKVSQWRVSLDIYKKLRLVSKLKIKLKVSQAPKILVT